MQELALDLLDSDAIILRPIFVQRNKLIKPRDIQEELSHYSNTQFKNTYKMLNLMPMHRWTLFSELAGFRKGTYWNTWNNGWQRFITILTYHQEGLLSG